MEKPLILFLVGPTASGKSEIAAELACLINAEIISADSMQVYRGMDILSAKPNVAQREKIAHHLIDILKPTQEYNAAVFCQKTLKLIKKIHQRKKIPLIVGGTGLYVKALKEGLFEDKGKDIKLRKKLYKQAQEKGRQYLYARLKKVDLETAKKIHPNDLHRIVRAIEVFRINKTPLSRLKIEREPLEKYYSVKIFGINRDRQELYGRIEKRIDLMFKAGIIKEVKKLKKLKLSQTAEKALGISQISAYLDGKYSLEQAKEILKRDSRRFAKRQLTWFRPDKNIVWIKANNTDKIEKLAKIIAREAVFA